jgi:hypothetical protein
MEAPKITLSFKDRKSGNVLDVHGMLYSSENRLLLNSECQPTAWGQILPLEFLDFRHIKLFGLPKQSFIFWEI